MSEQSYGKLSNNKLDQKALDKLRKKTRQKKYDGPDDWSQEELARLDKWAGDLAEAAADEIEAYWRNPILKKDRFRKRSRGDSYEGN